MITRFAGGAASSSNLRKPEKVTGVGFPGRATTSSSESLLLLSDPLALPLSEMNSFTDCLREFDIDYNNSPSYYS